MNASTAELVGELQLFAKTNSPQKRSKLDLPRLSALAKRNPNELSVAKTIDAAVAKAATQPATEPLATLFLPSDDVWESNLSGRQRQAAAQVGMSYDSFRRRRNGQPSPYDTLCVALVEQILRSLPEPSTPRHLVVSEMASPGLVASDSAVVQSDNRDLVMADAAASGRPVTASAGVATAGNAGHLDATRNTPDTAIASDVARPKRAGGGRLWGGLAVAALLLFAVVGARQLRSSSTEADGTELQVVALAGDSQRSADLSTEPAETEAPVTTGIDLGPPTDLVASAAVGGIELSWTPANNGRDPDGYDIARDGAGYWSLEGADTLTFVDELVESGRSYTYAVTPWLANGSELPADRTYGPSTETVEVLAVAVVNFLGELTDFAAEPTAPGIKLSWAPAVVGEVPDGFDITRDGVGFWSLDDPAASSFTDEQALPGQTYTYSVTPWLANGSDDPADRTYGPSTSMVEVAATLVMNSLGQPIDFIAVATDAGIGLEWKPPIEGVAPDGFDVKRDGEGIFSLDDPTALTFVDEQAEAGQLYTYAVTPWLANGSDDPADRTYGPASRDAKAIIEG